MITLYTFGPCLGAPDASPFVMKTMLLLKFAGLPYREQRGLPFRAPKGLLPYIEDDGIKVADSTFIRLHIEKKYGFDFDAGLDGRQKAISWAVEKMCEEHLYWALVHLRWAHRTNFARGVGQMFGAIPAPLRPTLKKIIRRATLKRIRMQGVGRHSEAEIAELAIRDVDALASLLGEHQWLMGERPCAADASVFGLLAALLTPQLDSPIIAAAIRHANLVTYRDRIVSAYFAGTRQASASG